MLPKHLLDTLDPALIHEWPFWTHPVGNGPYRYVRHVPTIMTELEPNPDYFGERPQIQRIVLRYGGNPITELLRRERGYRDRHHRVASRALATDPRFRIYHNIDHPNKTVINWNQNNPLFRDVDVRRALTMSIDRRTLYQVLGLSRHSNRQCSGVVAKFRARRGPGPPSIRPDGRRQVAGARWLGRSRQR